MSIYPAAQLRAMRSGGGQGNRHSATLESRAYEIDGAATECGRRTALWISVVGQMLASAGSPAAWIRGAAPRRADDQLLAAPVLGVEEAAGAGAVEGVADELEPESREVEVELEPDEPPSVDADELPAAAGVELLVEERLSLR